MIEYKGGVVVVVGGSGGRCFLEFCNWEGTASDIIDASRYFAGCQIHEDAAKVGKQLRKFTQQLHDLDAIIYSVGSSRADGKRVLTFASNNPFTVPSVPSVLTVPSVPSVPNTETGQTNT